MTNGHIGYINKELYTDVQSWEVFEENGKTFAVEVKIVPDKVKPNFIPGGFSAICTNNIEVMRNGKIVRDGEPFEIELKRGFYGCYGFVTDSPIFTNCLKEAETAKAEFERTIARMTENDPHFVQREVVISEGERNGQHYFQVVGYLLTKSGRRMRKFRKLGERIEEKCRYFYDYNF